MREPGTLKWFGEKWGPICDATEQVPVPVGTTCVCTEEIGPEDSGIIIPHFESLDRWILQPMHRECFIRNIFGSIAHQEKRCSCFGGEDSDPDGISQREAAKLVELWLMKHPPNITPEC